MVTHVTYENVIAHQSYNVPFSWMDDSQILVSGNGSVLEINVGYTLNKLQGTITPLFNYSELLIVRNTLDSNLDYDFTSIKNLKGAELQRALDIVKSISEESFTQGMTLGELENYKVELDSFRQEAADSAGIASTKATEASESADIASTKASEASTSADIASTKATEASTSADIASTKASEASTSATNALNSEEMAYKWAEEAEDVEVLPGEFSAHHWAIKAEAAAAGGGGGGGGFVTFNTPINVYVGPGGDYTNINDALDYLETLQPKFINNGFATTPQANLIFKTGYRFWSDYQGHDDSIYIINRHMPWLNITQENINTPLLSYFYRARSIINILSSTLGEIRLNIKEDSGSTSYTTGLFIGDGSFINYLNFTATNMRVGVSMRNSTIRSIYRLVITNVREYGLDLIQNSKVAIRENAYINIKNIHSTTLRRDGAGIHVSNSKLIINRMITPYDDFYDFIPDGPTISETPTYLIYNADIGIDIDQQGEVIIEKDALTIQDSDIGIKFSANGGKLVYTNADIVFTNNIADWSPADLLQNTWDPRGIIIN